ncbi:adenine deaminase C-terminal domain-containing protein [Streptomyces rhizosphaericus]|uniref:Adenine deaminase n=1 Tax=Streptomyces rhizosphaericus TaxID=114699 RepID=A0A6G4ATJ8_9ACTN|nr:adenine deaminase C-terminal domain-containing protein [Streptomyces rhizosphaericus]NEW75989.1 adenine deaminase [Streptomyces rhizosphaericus]
MPMPSRCDLLIRGAGVVSVHTGEIRPADVVVTGDLIRAVVAPGVRIDSDRVLDAEGLLLAPGYIDAHMHIESSLLTPAEFARITVRRGTTTVLADPHEIVNVAGRDAMAWMIEQGRAPAQTMLWAVPSCVPALEGFETAGSRLTAEDIAEMLDWDGVTTLGEVMDYRAVVEGSPRMRSIVEAARRKGVRLDGHCPGLTGDDLGEYLWAGIDSDHTKNTPEVAVEKARLGMLLMLQEKCLTPELVARLRELPVLPDFCLVTDDLAADAILERGHLDHIARVALDAGLSPLTVLRALTLHPARRLGLDDRGVVAPGKRADLVLLRALEDPTPVTVVCGGQVVEAADADATAPVRNPFADSVRLSPLDEDDCRWRVELPDGEHTFRALRVNPVDTFTEPAEVVLPVRDGTVKWEGRTAVLAVYERHQRSGRRTMAPVVGFELAEGAVATTYAHDSHNLTVVATDATALRHAANRVIGSHGGICVAVAGEPVVHLPLPVGGVMSPAPAAAVARGAAAVREALHRWGWRHRNAFMSISTMTLPVSPRIKLTDKGLVRVVDRAWEPAVVRRPDRIG